MPVRIVVKSSIPRQTVDLARFSAKARIQVELQKMEFGASSRMRDFEARESSSQLSSSPPMPYPAIRARTFSISAFDNSGGVPICRQP